MSIAISRDGTLIAFEEAGQGPAVILIDGAFGNRADGSMPQLATLLAQHFTVITYDRRGRNESGDASARRVDPALWDVSDLWKEAGGAAQLYEYYASAAPTPYAVEREVEDIAALITHVGGAAYLYGYSSGAILALLTAAELGGVLGLALYDPALTLRGSGEPTAPDYLAQLQQLQAADRYDDMVEYFLLHAVGVSSEEVTRLRGSDEWPTLIAVAPTLVYDTLIMGAFPSERELNQTLQAVKAPALLVRGGKSPAYLQHAAAVIAPGTPGATLQTLDDQAHNMATAAIAPTLIEFFQHHAVQDVAALRKAFVLDVLRQGDLSNCYKASTTIIELHLDEAIPLLLGMLPTAPAALKRDAIIPTLRDLGALEAAPALRELLATSEAPGVISAATQALEVLSDPSIGPELLAALERMTMLSNQPGLAETTRMGYDNARWQLVRSLVNLKVEESLTAILPMLGEPSPSLRSLAETAVAELGQPETLTALAQWEERLTHAREEYLSVSRLQKLRRLLKSRLKAKGLI